MTTAEPLKSAISIGNVDDTSLALPSAHQCRSGPQRVLEQVQTMRRTKGRHLSSRSGSTSLSPTSPVNDSVFVDGLKSPWSTSDGSVFFGNGFSKALNLEKTVNRKAVNNIKGSSVKRNTAGSAYRYERSYGPFSSMAVGQCNTSRSEPDLAWRHSVLKRSSPPQRPLSNKSTYRAERATSQFIMGTAPQPLPQYTMNGTGQTRSNTQLVYSQVDVSKSPPKPSVSESASKSKGESGSNGNSGVGADITMKEAVEYLSNDETYQHCGASYIQHNTFIDDKAKEEVLKLNGIPPLVRLLRSPSSQVNQTASAALRNLSFKNNNNKEEIHHCDGITEAVALLRESDSVETQKQLTGLLWNLSSLDSLKPDLLKSALPVLMERVILPHAAGPYQTNCDPEVFFHTTGCLRNLSSTKQSNRQTMRKCRGLVDSLAGYVKDCVEAGNPDDKSVENCVCVLHNLTFQLEAEAPALFSRMTALAKTVNRNHSQGDAGPISCFSPQNKLPELERHFDFPVIEDPQPTGAGWLIHSKTLQSYLSLLGSSQQEETHEACCGAMQNLTAHEGIVSGVMSQIIVQKLNGLTVISPLLKSNRVNLQRNTVALVGNLAKNPNLHNTLARRALPELLAILSAGTKEGNESDDTLAMACCSANYLLMKEPEMGKHLLNNNLINSLKDLSHNEYFPKSKKAAAVLLYNLWSEKDLQSFLKKQGMTKSSFVNDTTMAAHKSFQVVD